MRFLPAAARADRGALAKSPPLSTTGAKTRQFKEFFPQQRCLPGGFALTVVESGVMWRT
jgi:hypothetical protein